MPRCLYIFLKHLSPKPYDIISQPNDYLYKEVLHLLAGIQFIQNDILMFNLDTVFERATVSKLQICQRKKRILK